MLESDWKLYRNMLTDMREHYLRNKNQELAAMLSNADKTPTECFWDTYEKIKQEGKILTDCLDHHSRSNMTSSILLMLHHGLMKKQDLAHFSHSLRTRIENAIRPLKP